MSCILLYNYILCIFNCGKMAATKITKDNSLFLTLCFYFLITKITNPKRYHSCTSRGLEQNINSIIIIFYQHLAITYYV